MAGPLDHVNLQLVDSMEQVDAFRRWLGQSREVLGFDTETTGFSHETDRIRLAQFGDYDNGWAIPYERWGGVALEAITKYEGQIVMHNSKFDARFVAEDGGFNFPWHRAHDTMAMAHIIDPLRPKGLKPLGAMLIDPRAASSQRLLSDAMSENKWTWETVPVDFPYYWIYGAMDPVLTCHIWRKFNPEIQASYKGVYDLEMGVTRVVAAMERKGARVDLAYSEKKASDLMTWSGQARDWLRDQWGIASPTDMKLLKFFEDGQIPFEVQWTKGGRKSMAKEVLQSIDHPVAETVLNIRKAEKLVGPYFRNFIDLADENDRIHCNVWTMGTRTARMSITNPALQTLPRKDPTVRTAVIPSEGNALLTCDYDQVEARLMAHFSKDPGLIGAFHREDEDFFCILASEIMGRPITKKDDPEARQLTKNSFYGKLYGAGVDKMAQTAKVAFDVMNTVNAGLDRKYPGIRLTQASINATARNRQHAEGQAYINTPTGRRMVADDNKEYTLTNYLIQCHSAEILKRKMLELDAMGLGEYLILPVHDELVFDVPAEDAADLKVTVEETMADLENYLVPITASADILTTDWGQKYR